MNEDQLLKRLKEIQANKHKTLAQLNVLCGQELEIHHQLDCLKKEALQPEKPKATLEVVE